MAKDNRKFRIHRSPQEQADYDSMPLWQKVSAPIVAILLVPVLIGAMIIEHFQKK